MFIIFYIVFVYTFCTYGKKYKLNILLLHFTESVYSVSEPWTLNQTNEIGYLPDGSSYQFLSLIFRP